MLTKYIVHTSVLHTTTFFLSSLLYYYLCSFKSRTYTSYIKSIKIRITLCQLQSAVHLVYKAKAGTIAIGKSRFGIPPPLSECHSLRVSHRTHWDFSPNLFQSQNICFYVCLFVWTRVILFQIKLSSLYEKSMNSPIVFNLKTYAPHTVRSPITRP